MLTEKEQELIHRAIDGELSAPDNERFEQLKGESEEAGRLYDDLCRLFDLLEACPDTEPSKDFSATVRDAIERSRLRKFRNKPFLWAMAASVLMAVGIVNLNQNSGLDNGNNSVLVGTMAGNDLNLSPLVHMEYDSQWTLAISIPDGFRLDVQGVHTDPTRKNITRGDLEIRNSMQGVTIRSDGPVQTRIPVVAIKPLKTVTSGGDTPVVMATLNIGDRIVRGRLTDLISRSQGGPENSQ